MSNKTKAAILKALTIVAIVLFVSIVPLAIFIDEQIMRTIAIIIVTLVFADVVSLIILNRAFGDVKGDYAAEHKLSERTRELILKTVLIIGIVLMFLLFPGSLLLAFVPSEETARMVFNGILLSLIIVGGLFMVLRVLFGGIKQKPTSAERIQLSFDTFNNLFVFLQNSLANYGYKKLNSLYLTVGCDLALFIKNTKSRQLDCFAVIRVPELTDKLIENANDGITSMLVEYFGTDTITDEINMISFFCVDRVTPAFQKLLNSNIQQGLKNGRLPTGYSFGGKTAYIAKQKDGLFVSKYKRLRRIFISIISPDK